MKALVQLLLLASILVVIGAPRAWANQCDGSLSEQNGDPRPEYTFPKDMRLKTEDINWLLEHSTSQETLKSIGRIFSEAENNSQYYQELSYLLAEAPTPIRVEREDYEAFKEYYLKVFDPKDYKATREAYKRLTLHFDHAPEKFEDRVLLAYFTRDLVAMPNELTESREETLKMRLTNNYSQKAYEMVLRNTALLTQRINALQAKDLDINEALQNHLVYVKAKDSNMFANGRRLQLGEIEKSSKRAPIDKDAVVISAGKNKIAGAEAYRYMRKFGVKVFKPGSPKYDFAIVVSDIFNKTIDFTLDAIRSKSYKGYKNPLRAVYHDLINQLEARVIEENPDGAKEIDRFSNLVNYVVLGGRLLEPPTHVRAKLVDSAKTLMMPAKAELTKSKQDKNNNGNGHYQPIKISITTELPKGIFSNVLEPQISKKSKKRKQPKVEAEETVKEPAEKEIDESCLEYWVENPDTDLRPGFEYRFSFIRNPILGEQKIVFPENVVSELNDMPEVRYKLLKALTWGYTARNSKKTPGIKLMAYSAGQKKQSEYEVKPGYLKWRLLMVIEDGQWVVKELFEK